MNRSSQVPGPTPSSSSVLENYHPAGLHDKSNEWFANLAAYTIDRIRARENRFYEAKELVDLLRAKEGWGYLCPIMRHLPELQQESPSSSNEQLKWLIQNVQEISNAKEKEEEDQREEAMAKEPGYPPKVREAVASIQAHARKTIAATLFSEYGGRPPTERLKNYLDSWIQLAYPEPVLRDAVKEQERTGVPIARDSMGLPYNLKIRENYDRFPGITSAQPSSQMSVSPSPVVVPSEGLAAPGVPGDPSDDGGSDSWSTEEDSQPGNLFADSASEDRFVEKLVKDIKEQLNIEDKKDKKGKKEKRAPRTLAEWFHFEDEEPKGNLVPEQSIAETGQNVKPTTSEDKVYTWDKGLDGPVVVRGFSPVSPPRARAILEEIDRVADSWRIDTAASLGGEASNSPESHDEVAEGSENDSPRSLTDPIGGNAGSHSEGRSIEGSANDTVQRWRQQYTAQSAPGNTISTEVALPSGNREESSTTHSV